MRAYISLLLILFAWGPVAASTPGKAGPNYEIDAKGRVVRLDGGKVTWATRLDRPFDPWRNAALDWDEWRVYVSLRDGVTALNASTGMPLWHSDGPSKRLLVSGRLVLALVGEDGTWWFVGRGAASGVRVFQVRLPPKPIVDWSVRDAGGLFVVQTGLYFGVKGLLIDRHGIIRQRLNLPVLAALLLGQGGVVLTSREVMRLSPDGGCRWTAPLEHWGLTRGGLVKVGGGGLVAYLYCPASDSGVQLVRFNAATGKVEWRARCAPLGVDLPKYWHGVGIAVKGERLRVISEAEGGTFFEELDLKTGKQLIRAVSTN
jgi:outer membrane protein assembly factor BamB